MSEEGGILAKPPKLFIRSNKKSKTSVSKVQEWRIESRPTKKKKKKNRCQQQQQQQKDQLLHAVHIRNTIGEIA